MCLKLACYKISPLAWIVRKLLSAAVGGERWVKVTAGPAGGAWMFVDLRAQKYYWLGTCKPEVCDVIARCVSGGETVYEVGAHRGYFTIVIARRVGKQGRVIAIEPDPKNREILLQTVRKDDLDWVEVEASALWDKPGTVPFAAGCESTSCVSDGATEVPAQTLNALTQRYGIPKFVKMDIEGAETRALLAADILFEFGTIFLVEVHGKKALSAIEKVCDQWPYTLTPIDQKAPQHILLTRG